MKGLIRFLIAMGLWVPSVAGEWPQWRGGEANGVAASPETVREFSEEKNLLWKADLPGRGCSTPIVLGEQIFVSSAIGDQDGVLCFDWKGKERWRHVFGQEGGLQHRKAGSGSNPSPLSDGERVYLYYKSGTVAALTLTGTVAWEWNIQKEHGANVLKWDLGTSPLFAGGYLVITVMQTKGDSFLLALDKKTGKQVWKTMRNLDRAPESGDGYSTPIVRTIEGVETIVTWGADHLTGHEARTGKLLWTCGGFNDAKEPKKRTISSVVVTEGVALVPGSRGAFVAGVQLGSEEILWKQALGSDSPSAVGHAGRFYVLTDKGRERGTVSCLEATTGKVLWKSVLGRSPSIYYSSPLLVGDQLYCAREDGVVFCGHVGKEGLEEITENRLEDTLVASPVAVGGKLLLRGHEKLYCFGKE